MDSSEVKLSCSLRWLSGMLLQNRCSDREHIQQLLLNPYHEGSLREDFVLVLTTPHVYTSVYDTIVPNEQPEEETFWPLIHSLARRGVYVMEGEGDAVNHAVLAQRNPFRKGSHLALMDALMSLYISSVVSVSKVVKTVKRFSTFNASKDLPNGIDGCLKLWLNKVSQFVCAKQRNEMDVLVQDPDARQRRRNKLKLLNAKEPSIHPVEDICSDIADGQCLAALLLHYVPDRVAWTDFNFGEQKLTRDQAQKNLSKVKDVCTSILPPPGFHISASEILQWSQSTLLKSNIQALLAHLYHSFDSKQCGPASTSTSVQHVSQQRQNGLSVVKRGSVAGIPPLSLTRKRHTIHSYSTSDLFTAASREQPGAIKVRQGTKYSQGGAGSDLGSSQGLSSYSMSALIENYEHERHKIPSIRNPAGPGSLNSTTSTNSAVFKAPVRTSITPSQAAALASFTKPQPPPLKKGPHTRSSPAMRISVTEVPPFKSSKSQGQITASTDNLLIREQMLTEKLNRVAASGAISRPPHYTRTANYNNSSGSSSSEDSEEDSSRGSSPGADVSGSCTTATQSWRNRQSPPVGTVEVVGAREEEYTDGTTHHGTPDRSDDDRLQLLTHAYPLSEDSPDTANLHVLLKGEGDSNPPPPLKSMMLDMEEKPEVRGSFTLNKHHTYASASAAGLPIIENSKTKDKDEEEEDNTPPLKDTNSSTKIQERSSSSGSSSGSVVHTVLHLTIYPNGSVNVRSEKPSTAVPPSVLELRRQLHAKMNERRTRQAVVSKQELIEKQKVGQKVYLAAMQKSRESSVERPSSPVSTRSKRPTERSQPKSPTPKKVISKHRTKDSEENRVTVAPPEQSQNTVNVTHDQSVPSRQAQNKTASLTQFEFLEAQVIANEALSSTAKKQTLLPKTHPLGAASVSLSPIAPCKVTEKMEMTSEEEEEEDVFGSSDKGGGGVGAQGAAVDHNPWGGQQQQMQLKEPTLNAVSQEELRLKRERLVKARLEEREKARKMDIERRRKQTKERALQQPAADTTAVQVAPGDKDTIHFALSSHQLPQTSQTSSVSSSPARASEASSRQSDYLLHNGPECYVKPQTKSNKKIIKNALCRVCLAGEVNLSIKQRALDELEASTANHVMVLFRDTIGFKFRALYWYSPDTEYVTKMFGTGPRIIKQNMVSHYYKYNSGMREFKEIQTRAFSLSLDAFTMKNEFWTTRKSNPLGKRTSTTYK